MVNTTTATRIPHFPSVEVAWQDVNSSFERFCLTAAIGAIEHMLCEDAQQLTSLPHSRAGGRVGHRRRHLEVGGLAPVRGAVGRTAGRVDGI